MAPLVDSSQIQGAELWKPLPFHFHAYVWPYVIAWPIFLRYYLSADLYEQYISSEEWTFVWVGTIVTFQSLTWLCTHWSVNLQTLFTASRAKSIDDAELIKVLPIANAGTAEVCKIIRDQVCLPDASSSSSSSSITSATMRTRPSNRN